jgi:drug/metabolite transporter (DMT)-like permease
MLTLGMTLALLSAFIYTGSSLFLKSAIERGATANQVNACTNILMAILVQPLWLFDRPSIANAPLWQPVLCGSIFFCGQIFTFAALSRGDVSVATPLLGTKILLVTVFNALIFGVPVTLRWWVAAFIASLAIAFIASGAPHTHRRAVGITVLLSLCAASLYSFTDALIQHWGKTFDSIAFLPVAFGSTGLLTLLTFAIRDRRAFRPRRAALPALTGGSILFCAQVTGFFFAIILTQNATLANVIYSTRSIWSVAAAWLGGHLLGLRDTEVGHAVMTRRLCGAILLFAAILLILL